MFKNINFVSYDDASFKGKGEPPSVVFVHYGDKDKIQLHLFDIEKRDLIELLKILMERGVKMRIITRHEKIKQEFPGIAQFVKVR